MRGKLKQRGPIKSWAVGPFCISKPRPRQTLPRKKMNPSKLQQAIVYIVGRMGSVPRTKLVKLVYLSDQVFYNATGRQLTEAEYRRQQRGPLPVHFNTIIEEMRGKELQVSERPAKNGTSFIHKVGPNPRFSVKLEDREREVLDHVVEMFGRLQLDSLLDLVYKTRPMTALLEKEARGESQLGAAIHFSEFIPTSVLTKFAEIKVDDSIRGSKEELRERDMAALHETRPLRQRAARRLAQPVS